MGARGSDLHEGEYLDAVVALIGYVALPTMDRDAPGSVDFPVAVASGAELAHERTIEVENLDTVIAAINNVAQPAVHCNARRGSQLPITTATGSKRVNERSALLLPDFDVIVVTIGNIA